MILIFAVILTCLTISVMITDTLRFIIPNKVVGVIVALYPVLLFIAPMRPDWPVALVIAVATFAVGFLFFSFKLMGGGDVKLMAALALFAGKDGFAPFIFAVALLGGALALVLLLLRPVVAFMFSKLKKPPAIPQVLTIGEPVPYGVAIAASFLLALWGGRIPGVPL